MSGADEFSVWWWDREDNQHEELRFVGAETAAKAAHRLCTGPAAKLGMVHRVIITDGGDFTNFEWKHDQGITFK
jgi:hypothetical protein